MSSDTATRPVEDMTVGDLKAEIKHRDKAAKTNGVVRADLMRLLVQLRDRDGVDAQGVSVETPDEIEAEAVEEEDVEKTPDEHESEQLAGHGAVSEELAVATEQALELRERAVQPQHALPGAGEFNAIMAIAERLAGSRIVPAAYQGKPDNIIAAVLMGRELGIGPMQSLKSISVIEDKPAPSAELLLAILKREGVVIDESGVNDERAWIRAHRSDSGESMTVEWLYSDAQKIKSKNGKVLADKDNWRNYRHDMLWARAVGRLARRLAPDKVAGMGYAAEEVQDFDDDWGSEYGVPTPVYRQDAPQTPPPRSAAEIAQRLSLRVGEHEAREWLRQAAIEWAATQNAQVTAFTELSPELKQVIGQKLAGVVVDLEEREAKTAEDLRMSTDVRSKVAEVFAKRLDGVALHGPPWRLGPDEQNLPTHDEYVAQLQAQQQSDESIEFPAEAS